jgi:hypothetical protein
LEGAVLSLLAAFAVTLNPIAVLKLKLTQSTFCDLPKSNGITNTGVSVDVGDDKL